MRIVTRFALLALLVTVGCTAQSNSTLPIAGVTPDQARQMNGERSTFEITQDPPITAETHFAAGQLSETHGEFAKAARQYREALKLEPNHRRSIYRLGVCLSHIKKHGEAASIWARYIELTGGDAVAFSNLGFCYELAGTTDRAEATYQKGIEKDPSNVACRTNYGLMLARLGRYAEATLQLQAVLSEAEVHYNLASVFEHQGRKEQARVEYKKALELEPGLSDARARLAGLQ